MLYTRQSNITKTYTDLDYQNPLVESSTMVCIAGPVASEAIQPEMIGRKTVCLGNCSRWA